MNKDLYIENEKTDNKNRKLRSIYYCLKNFLEENEEIFKNKESIEALKSIREYLTNLKSEVLESNKECLETHKKLIKSCDHEVAIKNSFDYQCLICERTLGSDIPKDSLISIDANSDYTAKMKIYEVFKEIVHSDKDLIETLSELLEELQYDTKIKVYRR